MIRYYPTKEYRALDINGTELEAPTWALIVTAKRRIRGYVKMAYLVKDYQTSSYVSGWTAVSLDGTVVGRPRKTKAEAVGDLVSNHKFRLIVVCPKCRNSFWDGDRCHGWLLDPCLKQAVTLEKK